MVEFVAATFDEASYRQKIYGTGPIVRHVAAARFLVANGDAEIVSETKQRLTIKLTERALLPEPEPVYHWREEDAVWWTDCGCAFMLEAGKPAENKYRGCPNCIRKVVCE